MWPVAMPTQIDVMTPTQIAAVLRLDEEEAVNAAAWSDDGQAELLRRDRERRVAQGLPVEGEIAPTLRAVTSQD